MWCIINRSRDLLESDEDVRKERQSIQNTSALVNGDNQVIISGLTKYYSANKAVDDLYVAIPKGECFGLLGIPTLLF